MKIPTTWTPRPYQLDLWRYLQAGDHLVWCRGEGILRDHAANLQFRWLV